MRSFDSEPKPIESNSGGHAGAALTNHVTTAFRLCGAQRPPPHIPPNNDSEVRRGIFQRKLDYLGIRQQLAQPETSSNTTTPERLTLSRGQGYRGYSLL